MNPYIKVEPMSKILTASCMRKLLASLCLIGSGVLLSSCGGGGAAALAGVGSGGTGLVQGLVVGFGSVFIDGKEYTTTSATIQQDDDQGQAQNALLKLGERVQATIDSTGTAVVTATVIPSLSGPVTLAASADASGDLWAKVNGQWIRIVTSATHTPLGLTTVLAGVNNVGATLSPNLAVGNEVEVHGVWTWTQVPANGYSYVLVASRVEVLPATASNNNILLGGVVVALPTNNQVTLNAASGGITLQGTLPSGLAVGQSVSAWVTRAAWNNWVNAGGNTPLTPLTLSIASLTPTTGSTNKQAQLSGLVSNYNAAAHTATVQGTLVTLPAGTSVADGDYIRLTGQAGTGTLSQTTVDDERSATSSVTAQTIKVQGTTNGINWSAGGTINFVLQSTSVTAAPGTYSDALLPCTGYTSSNTVYVVVKGQVPAPGQPVVADSVTCSVTPPSDSVTDFHGTIQSVDTAHNTLSLINDGKVLTVGWTATTFVDPALVALGNWIGQGVEVMGTLSGTSAMTATVIRLDSGGTND